LQRLTIVSIRSAGTLTPEFFTGYVEPAGRNIDYRWRFPAYRCHNTDHTPGHRATTPCGGNTTDRGDLTRRMVVDAVPRGRGHPDHVRTRKGSHARCQPRIGHQPGQLGREPERRRGARARARARPPPGTAAGPADPDRGRRAAARTCRAG